MDDPSNDNTPAGGRLIRIVGRVSGDGRVTITDPTWRPATARVETDARAWPNDPREA